MLYDCFFEKVEMHVKNENKFIKMLNLKTSIILYTWSSLHKKKVLHISVLGKILSIYGIFKYTEFFNFQVCNPLVIEKIVF